MRLPERLSVIARFRRGPNRLHFELWTTPVGDQLRSYVDGYETYARIVRDCDGSVADEILAMRRYALEDGRIEEPPPSA